MGKKMALGKGIASLLQDTPNQILSSLGDQDEPSSNTSNVAAQGVIKEVVDSGLLMVKVSEVVANPDQPRKIFRQDELSELAESIRENGILQPLIVTKTENSNYEIIAGERRFRAAKCCTENVPVVVKKTTKKRKWYLR